MQKSNTAKVFSLFARWQHLYNHHISTKKVLLLLALSSHSLADPLTNPVTLRSLNSLILQSCSCRIKTVGSLLPAKLSRIVENYRVLIGKILLILTRQIFYITAVITSFTSVELILKYFISVLLSNNQKKISSRNWFSSRKHSVLLSLGIHLKP